MDKKFNVKKLEKLNNPKRLESIPPKYIMERLNIEDESIIVDIGAGTGLFSKAFLEILNNITVYAMDISDTMIEWMKGHLPEKVIPMLMGENNIPLDDNFCDLAIMITLHHELESPEHLLNETKRILKNGGKICIIDWKKEEMPMGPVFEIRCSKSAISDDLVSAGFKNIKTDESMGRFNMVWAQK